MAAKIHLWVGFFIAIILNLCYCNLMKKIRCWKRLGDSKTEKCMLSDVLDFLERTNKIQCDTETTGLSAINNDILCIQFGTKEEQYLVEWDSEILPPVLEPYFQDDTKRFIFVNAKFDLDFLLKYKLFIKHVYDIYLVECIITNDGIRKRRGYKALAKKYLGHELDKQLQALIPELGLTAEVIEYALDDVKYLMDIAYEQAKVIREQDLAEVVKLENKVAQVLAYVQHCGIKLDKEKWLDLYKNNVIKREKVLVELSKTVGTIPNSGISTVYDIRSDTYVANINWDSSSQVIPLMEKLGIEVIDDKGKKTLEAKKILMRQKDKHPIVPLYLEYKEFSHAIQSFGLGYLNHVNNETGRIHTQFNQLSTDTGRMSCGNSRDGDGAPNLQQVPAGEEFRSCFVAEKGNKLVCSDYSGQEAVIFANLCLDENLLEFYDEDKGDMHSYVAKLCFPDELGNIEVEDVKSKFPELRQQAKAAGFAINYGGNGYTIAKNLALPIEQGDEIYNRYMEAFPGIKEYAKRVSDEAFDRGYILCDNVVRRKFFIYGIDEVLQQGQVIRSFTREDWVNYRIEKEKNSLKYQNELKPMLSNYFKSVNMINRKALNYSCQSSGGSMTKIAAVKLWNYIVENNALFTVKIINIVHDEIILECPETIAEEVSAITKKCMEEAADLFCQRVNVKANPVIADLWVH